MTPEELEAKAKKAKAVEMVAWARYASAVARHELAEAEAEAAATDVDAVRAWLRREEAEAEAVEAWERVAAARKALREAKE